MFWRKPDNASLLRRIKELELIVDELQHSQKRIHRELQTLGGRYYKRFGGGDGDPAPTPAAPEPVSGKAALRQQFGVVPGRPAPHN